MSETPFFSPEIKKIELPDGRALAYALYGAARDEKPGGLHSVVFHFHGFPGTHHEAFMVHDAAVAHGLQIVALDRPGFGESTFNPNHTLRSWPADVLAVADHFGIQRFAVIGVSAGGPHAIACLHELPRDRLAGVVAACSLFPGALGYQGMRLPMRLLLSVGPWISPALAWMVEGTAVRYARDDAHPEYLEDAVVKQLSSTPPADQAVFDGNVSGCRDCIVASVRDAMKPGGQGFAHETKVLGSPWGFELKDLDAKSGRLVFWHGTEDANVPFSMAQRALEHAPGLDMRVVEGEAHASALVVRANEMMVTLKGMLG